jgi:hypothetical protein
LREGKRRRLPPRCVSPAISGGLSGLLPTCYRMISLSNCDTDLFVSHFPSTSDNSDGRLQTFGMGHGVASWRPGLYHSPVAVGRARSTGDLRPY